MRITINNPINKSIGRVCEIYVMLEIGSRKPVDLIVVLHPSIINQLFFIERSLPFAEVLHA